MKDLFENWEKPKKNIRYIYCFDKYNKYRRILSSSVKGVMMFNKTSGEVLTAYGFCPWTDFGEARFYKSKKDLFNSVGFGELI